MKFGRFDRFDLFFTEYPSGVVVVEEPHTQFRFEGEDRTEVSELMVMALTEWMGDRPDPDTPIRTVETVHIDRNPPGFFQPPF